MLAYFIIGLSLFVALLIGGNSLANADPKKLVKALRISATIICALLAGFFILTGRFAYAPPFVIAALFFLRNKPLFGAGNAPSSGQQSDVETDWIKATLNHDSGEMDGQILKGKYESHILSTLSFDQLMEFHDEAQDDPQTLAILNSFLDRYHAQADASGATSEEQTKEQKTRKQSGTGPMTRREALDILELTDDATLAQIKKAHRQLMKKFHPDHDGSEYMAAKINEAKDVLIKTN
ncbi:DnaJ domain-containing protein [Sneathiella marina]|uniref:DnaJ domain-containing protein n=1 Tax=Sneathiella marina TaxID=2950108 RepID=A0ABY4VZP4_9PROT|nr:DnaJ domain-containing protein [Sneathiella marina]USG60189.1 DnaJ domain-containing protein [Sneathiella marina]